MGKINRNKSIPKPALKIKNQEDSEAQKPKKISSTTLFKAKTIVEKKNQKIASVPAKNFLKEATKEIKTSEIVTVKSKPSKPSQKQPEKRKTKKEKQEEKHQNLLKKFQDQKKKDKEERKRKNREKTAVVGDMRPMKDALPSLDDLFAMDRSQIKTGIKEVDLMSKKKLTKIEKVTKRKNQVLSRMNCIEEWMKDPDFKKNPREAIAAHIKYMKSLEE